MGHQTTTSAGPVIGSEFAGGIYAGITTGKDGQPYALILLTEKPATELTWQGAKDWAAGIEGQLPNRVEGALLFANLREQFTRAAYWTCEEFDASWAWCQLFNSGGQYGNRKSSVLRARAVRRLPIQSLVI